MQSATRRHVVALLVLALVACAGDPDPATERSRQIADLRGQLAGETIDDAARAKTAWKLGELLHADGLPADAEPHLEVARRHYAAQGDKLREARVLLDLAAARFALGRLSAAEGAWGLALVHYRELEVERGQASALHGLGLAAASRGDAATAVERYRQALALWRRAGATAAEGVTLQALGSLYARLGRGAEAVDLLTAALDGMAETAHGERAAVLVSLAITEHQAGDGQAALVRLEEAHALARRAADLRGEASALDHQGMVLRTLGRHDEARRALRAALALHRRSGSVRAQGHTLASLGWLALDEGRPETARDLFGRAQRFFVDADGSRSPYVDTGLGVAARRLGDHDEAVARLSAAVNGLETLRREVPGGLSRGTFHAVHYDAHEQLATLLADLDLRRPGRGFGRRALEVAEASRSRSLLDRLAGGDEAAATTGTRRRLLAEIDDLETRRTGAEAESGEERQMLAAEIRRLWLDVERLDPAPPAPAPPLGAGEMEALVGDGSLAIVYLLAEPESLAWTVDQHGTFLHRLPGRGEVERRARRAAAALRDAGSDENTRRVVLGHLADAVLASLGERLEGRRRLLIFADGALHRVPFAALPRPVDGEPLVAGGEVVSLPSVAVLAALRRRGAERTGSGSLLAAVGDPVVRRDDPRFTTAATVEEPPAGDLDRTLDDLDLRDLPRLPAAGREAAAIAALAPPESTLLATGFAADRALVLGGELGAYRIVHFATHGVVHPLHPSMSGVVLSLYDAGGTPRPGYLAAADLEHLDLAADLVVLSACHTAGGAEVRGEGLVGLVDALFTAGAQRVVGSLWKVGDEPTAELMQDFYRHLLVAGEPPGEALRAAQLAARRRGEPPAAWAAFQLHGDPAPLSNLLPATGVGDR